MQIRVIYVHIPFDKAGTTSSAWELACFPPLQARTQCWQTSSAVTSTLSLPFPYVISKMLPLVTEMHELLK